MARYRAKERKIIYAEQFLPPLQIPIGVHDLQEYQLSRIKHCFGYVTTLQGEEVRVECGEWIIEEHEDPSRHYPISNEVFNRLYELYESEQGITKEFLMDKFLSILQIQKLHRFATVRKQFNRNVWQVTCSIGMLEISSLDSYKITFFPTMSFCEEYEVSGVQEHDLSKDEYNSLKKAYFGYFSPDLEYLKKIGVNDSEL